MTKQALLKKVEAAIDDAARARMYGQIEIEFKAGEPVSFGKRKPKNWTKRRTVTMPRLTDKATGCPVLDEEAYGRWPHLFSNLARRYRVPDHFLLTLLFLWDQTMGSQNAPCGHVALSQIPVREREARKWLAALVKVGFFNVIPAKLGDKRGSYYDYEEETAPAAWEKFFDFAGTVTAFGNWDGVSPARFANMAARAIGANIPPSNPVVPEPEITAESRARAIAAAKQRAARG